MRDLLKKHTFTIVLILCDFGHKHFFYSKLQLNGFFCNFNHILLQREQSKSVAGNTKEVVVI